MKPLPPLVLIGCLAAMAVGAADKPPSAELPKPVAGTPVAPNPATGPILPPVVRREAGSRVWLGCVLDKPEPSAAAQIPSLPPGMGLVVRDIISGSPAESAKLEPLDVLWKFEEQLLVNRSQLAVLLNLKSPGEEVRVAVFRAGKSIDLTIKLGVSPPGSEEQIFPRHGGGYAPPIVIEKIPGNRTASSTNLYGRMVMQRVAEGYRVIIRDNSGKQTFEKIFSPEGQWEGLPDGWHRTIWVLRRSLDNLTENGLTTVRPPRPRVVPPPEDKESPKTN